MARKKARFKKLRIKELQEAPLNRQKATSLPSHPPKKQPSCMELENAGQAPKHRRPPKPWIKYVELTTMTISSKSTNSLPDRQLQRLFLRTTDRTNANDASNLSREMNPHGTILYPRRIHFPHFLNLRPIQQMQRILIQARSPADQGDLLQ